MYARQQALGVGHVALKFLDDLSELVASLRVLVDLCFEVFENLGVDHSCHICCVIFAYSSPEVGMEVLMGGSDSECLTVRYLLGEFFFF